MIYTVTFNPSLDYVIQVDGAKHLGLSQGLPESSWKRC